MRYSIEQLRSDVMARLGETARPRDAASATSIPWPEDIIGLKAESLLAELGGRLIREAPLELLGCGALESGVDATTRLMPCGLYAAEVRLPDGFLRLVWVKMSGWRGSVTSLITPSMGDWRRQWSDHPGIAGCPEWPRAYLDSDSEGLLLRLVGSNSPEYSVEWLGVWCVPVLSEDNEFDFPEGLYPELVGKIVLSLQS